MIASSDGTIYFSDPWYGRMPGFGIERERELGYQGVYRIPPGGGQDELRCSAEDEFDQPNGLCFSPDEKLLYINDTPRAHIKVFDANDDGTVSNGRMFFEGIGTGVIEEGIPDGMKCDERGNIWVTGPQGVWVISTLGRAPGNHRGARGRRQPSRGAGRTGRRSSSRPRARSTRSARRWARIASPTCADGICTADRSSLTRRPKMADLELDPARARS